MSHLFLWLFAKRRMNDWGGRYGSLTNLKESVDGKVVYKLTGLLNPL